MGRSCTAWAWAIVMVGCGGGTPMVVKSPEVESKPRPNWSANLGPYVDAMSACLEGREEPRGVAFVEPLTSGASGISTVDAYGSIENCAFQDGKVVWREQTTMHLGDVAEAGGAVFSLGARPPGGENGRLMVEVLNEGSTLGWMYWPAAEPRE